MSQYQMGVVETRFAEIIWDNEPLSSMELVRKAGELLDWKKSTTFTVLRRLCEKGLFRNESGVVTSLVTRDQFFAAQSRQYIDDIFGGSLPAFLAAFTAGKKLTEAEAAELQRIIDRTEHRNG
ncbi:MAG: BlaI/MecI/CopY family transcriptional regulator [Lachnospiraceae bacterium]|nr:BlaI/MecI/CopY family transcriptional regulator [Lachnospiraceae bacterium]